LKYLFHFLTISLEGSKVVDCQSFSKKHHQTVTIIAKFKLGVVVHSYKPSCWEAEVG
jgi:hypothetical protein